MTCAGDSPSFPLILFTSLLASWPKPAAFSNCCSAQHLSFPIDGMLVNSMITSCIKWFFSPKGLVTIAKYRLKWTYQAFRKCKKGKISGRMMKAFISVLLLQLLLMGWTDWWVWWYEHFSHILSLFDLNQKANLNQKPKRQFLCSCLTAQAVLLL